MSSQGALFRQHNKLLFKILRLLQELSADVSGLLGQVTPASLARSTSLLASVSSEGSASHTPKSLVSKAAFEPHIPIPSCYSGEVGHCVNFWLPQKKQCLLVFDLKTLRYDSDRAKMVLIEHRTLASASYNAFVMELRRVFDHPVWSGEGDTRLFSFAKASASVANYSMQN